MTRYEYGGDEFIFVELAEAMSLETNFKAMAITKALREKKVSGILDICPSNASYMIRFNPDLIHPDDLISKLKELEQDVTLENFEITARAVDVPILFEDPWTHEALMRFRDRHQDSTSTDIEYVAHTNGFQSKEDLIKSITDAPYLVSMIGFVPGLPWCYQMVPNEKQIEAPKYVRPRTYTPERAFGFGGSFAVIYPVQGAGGYQLFGTAAAPIFEKEQRLHDFKESMTFPRQGDVFRYRSISMEEYEDIRKQVENGEFRYLTKDITFKPKDVLENPNAFSESVIRRLYA
ncbi:carboxyltransferase domain-containing protein [Peribacillus sp. TH16]|uniref:5-oxoprolinase subunit B family protein n=1 Tax=Peribacillus sp. TH16 TaxID=2798482 RepID=UPI0019149507|nr:carboxyltransferase domain-containing protein [Peribacillus sp. TH16]MBK5481985.1 carboxyltransferase domain-containing protein [Peribacillus sp. TH16]